jgi:pyruvate,orthophosphate dikinase
MIEASPQLAMEMIAPGAGLPKGGANAVGNKAFNLMRMATAGLPAPPGFVLPTSWCARHGAGDLSDQELDAALAAGIAQLEKLTRLEFGGVRRPLLVSVRSGAKVSMPGMMETVLDIGVNDETVEGLIRLTGNPRLAWDSYRRFVQGYADVVAGLPSAPLDSIVESALSDEDVESERDLDHVALRTITKAMLAAYRELAGESFPQEPRVQLARAAAAVFKSWSSPRAVEYRRLYHIDDAAGTAVTVQTMVYGNAGGSSGAGVGFTRNPATGDDELYLDFQFNAQGEDIVSGRRALSTARLRSVLPSIWDQLEAIRRQLETLFGDAQDFEFTVQDGALYLLQTRSAKRTPWAAVKIAVDLVRDAILTPNEALDLLKEIDLSTIIRTRLDRGASKPLAQAIVASIGVAVGPLALDSAAAERFNAEGRPPILVRRETTTADIVGMAKAAGVLTALGGRTSHAAVVARQLGRVCLVGCAELEINLARRTCAIGSNTLNEGDWITLDGNEGGVYVGHLAVVTERPAAALAIIEEWKKSPPAAA